MIAGIFLCFVAIGIATGAVFYGYGATVLILALLPASGLALGLVSLAWSRSGLGNKDHIPEV